MKKLPGTSFRRVRVWRNFPEDLYELVLANLSVVTKARFRLVCKNWNSLLTDSSFSCSLGAHPLFYSLYYIRDTDGIFMSVYDPCSNRWYHPTFPCPQPERTKGQEPLELVGSAQGLVCFVDTESGDYFVSNPISRSFKALPRLDCVWPSYASYMSMVPDKTARSDDNGFVIIWVDVKGFISFYRSRDNSWIRNPPPDDSRESQLLLLHHNSQVVYVDDTLYSMRIDKPEVIVSYHVATGVWKQTQVPPPLMNFAIHEMTAYQGKIMLIGIERREYAVTAVQVWIWELQQTAVTHLWKEVGKMPESMDIDMGSLVKEWSVNCYVGNRGDLIMWTFNPRQPNQRHVIYNFRTREWRFDVPIP